MEPSCPLWLIRFLFGVELRDRAARTVTKILLNKCKWLSLNQLVFYHSMLRVYKVLNARTPLYLCQDLHTEHPFQQAGVQNFYFVRNSGLFSIHLFNEVRMSYF